MINHMIQELNDKFDKKLFSVEAISEKGDEYIYNNEKTVKIRLLCDDDIIALSKSLLDDSLIDEYFERNKRRHPSWKSEAEYNAYIEEELKGNKLEEVKAAIDIILDSLEEKKVYAIDEEYMNNIEAEIAKLDEVKSSLDPDTFAAQMKGKSEIRKICNGLKKYAEANNLMPDYVFLKTTQFSSGFGKPDFTNIFIVFDKGGKCSLKRFKEVVPTFDISHDKKDYIYSKNIEKNPIENKSIYSYLVKEFL